MIHRVSEYRHSTEGDRGAKTHSAFGNQCFYFNTCLLRDMEETEQRIESFVWLVPGPVAMSVVERVVVYHVAEFKRQTKEGRICETISVEKQSRSNRVL